METEEAFCSSEPGKRRRKQRHKELNVPFSFFLFYFRCTFLGRQLNEAKRWLYLATIGKNEASEANEGSMMADGGDGESLLSLLPFAIIDLSLSLLVSILPIVAK